MRNQIIIVDDMDINRDILEEIMEDEFEVLTAVDGEQGLEMIRDHRESVAAVLLDLVMPKMDGFEVLEELNKVDELKKIPVLIISGEDSVNIEKKCFEYGISDFIRKPFDSILAKKRVKNAAELFQYQSSLEEKVAKQTETLHKQYKLLQIQADKLKKSNENIIDILGTVVEGRNMESGEHIKRVKGYTKILADKMKDMYPEYDLTAEKINIIVSASSLHDIGKIAIPDHILLKPGKLTDEEFEYMKSHTTRGCEILDDIKGVWDEEYGKVSYEICRHHHERFDGRGYPDKLKGEEIPISAQLVSVADVYDALVNERCYKDAYSKDKAFQMIINGECGMFNPKLLECFRNVREDFEGLADEISA
ncbi:MAG: response regulator [Lachnospiraceae bacterium]|nr:response regulator [Lachnospiraceae bacterium]